MRNFFIDDRFFSDMDDYFQEYDLTDFDSDEELRGHIMSYPDTWEQKAELADCEKVIKIDDKFFTDIADEICHWNEDRMPEEPDRIIKKVELALKQSIDLAKLNELLPEMWYPNGKIIKLTKQDLLDAI